jgi:hypothetical protein
MNDLEAAALEIALKHLLNIYSPTPKLVKRLLLSETLYLIV